MADTEKLVQLEDELPIFGLFKVILIACIAWGISKGIWDLSKDSGVQRVNGPSFSQTAAPAFIETDPLRPIQSTPPLLAPMEP